MTGSRAVNTDGLDGQAGQERSARAGQRGRTDDDPAGQETGWRLAAGDAAAGGWRAGGGETPRSDDVMYLEEGRVVVLVQGMDGWGGIWGCMW